MKTIVFFSVGVLFGITLYMSEVSSWFQTFGIFRFESFHMFGVIGSAIIGAFSYGSIQYKLPY